MDYQRHYNLLIEKSLSSNRYLSCYTEKHHIVPRCLNGTNEESNIVRLTAREHFVAHILLAKIHGGKLWHAAHMMSNMKRYSSRKYEFIRKEHARTISKTQKGRIAPSGVDSPSFGIKRSQEFKNAVSERRKGSPTVVNHTEETKEKMRIARKKQKYTSQKPVVVFGIKYNSIKEATDVSELGYKAIKHRLNSANFPDCYRL